MVYIPEDWKLSNYERVFESHGSSDVYYPRVIIQNHLKESILEDIYNTIDEPDDKEIQIVIKLIKKRFEE